MPSSGEARPDPKARTLARGPRRYRRKVASRKQWEALRAEKLGPCRTHGAWVYMEELHHIVRRNDGGDDVADNLVPLCLNCHDRIHARDTDLAADLLETLSDAEYAYAIQRGGEGYFERVYGVRYER